MAAPRLVHHNHNDAAENGPYLRMSHIRTPIATMLV
jgi:hypothetical protein